MAAYGRACALSELSLQTSKIELSTSSYRKLPEIAFFVQLTIKKTITVAVSNVSGKKLPLRARDPLRHYSSDSINGDAPESIVTAATQRTASGHHVFS